MPTRRRFLRDCSVVAATASFTPASLLAEHVEWRPRVPEYLTCQLFAEELNTLFSLGAGWQTLKLLLVEARPAPPAPPQAEDARNERFSLLFRGPAQQPLDQDTYGFEHRRLGRLEIFIVPMGSSDPAYRYYEAVFNHPSSQTELAVQLSRAPVPLRTAQSQ